MLMHVEHRCPGPRSPEAFTWCHATRSDQPEGEARRGCWSARTACSPAAITRRRKARRARLRARPARRSANRPWSAGPGWALTMSRQLWAPLGDQMRGHGVRHADPDSDAAHPVPRRRVEADALSGSPGPVLWPHHGVEQGIPDDHRGGRDRDRECDVVERARSPADSCQARPVSAIFGRPRMLVPNSMIGIVGTCPSRRCSAALRPISLTSATARSASFCAPSC